MKKAVWVILLCLGWIGASADSQDLQEDRSAFTRMIRDNDLAQLRAVLQVSADATNRERPCYIVPLF